MMIKPETVDERLHVSTPLGKNHDSSGHARAGRAIALAVLAALSSCSLKVRYTHYRDPATPGNSEKIRVYDQEMTVPGKFTILGKLEFRDTGFSKKCSREEVLKAARKKAAEIGADAIKIIKLMKPDLWNNCYRMDAHLIEIE
jgi:hypothetical protein